MAWMRGIRFLAWAGVVVAAGLATKPVQADVYDVAIWDLQAVDANGFGTHPQIGTEDQVRFTGVVLNDPADMLNPGNPGGSGADAWQVYVQALPDSEGHPQHGGIAVFAASPYQTGTGGTWPTYPTDFAPGDVVEVVGYISNYNGKVNLNERHHAYYAFTITHVQDGGANLNIGRPEPFQVPSVADGTYFDPARAGGGELYQGQWCTLTGLSMTGGAWGTGETITVADGSLRPDATPATIDVSLGYDGFFGTGAAGDFDAWPAPAGKFNVTAIFNQEDEDLDDDGVYGDGYSLWPLEYAQFALWGDADGDGLVEADDYALVQANLGMTNASWTDGDFDANGVVDATDLAELMVNLPEPATLTLALVGGLAVALRRRRSRTSRE